MLASVELRQDEMQTATGMGLLVQQLHLSDTLYAIYGRMRRSEQLTHQEREIIQELQICDRSLNEEHRAMLHRIAYRLNKHERQHVRELVAC